MGKKIRITQLTPRQKISLEMMKAGFDNAEIARELGVSRQAIFYRRKIYEKSGLLEKENE